MKNLRNEAEIMQTWRGDSAKPLVSICCITYNHEPYIREALEGFFLQETDFPFEIIIHDDSSTDCTADIIRKYEKKYPNLIRPIYQKENQFTKIGFQFLEGLFHVCSGDYIAICEGDDYWTDPNKLQKQVDLLEKNPDCSLCFHASKHAHANAPERDFIHRPKNIPKNGFFAIKHAILGGGGFMATNSMLFPSKYMKQIPAWMVNAPVADVTLMLFLGSKGKIAYIDDVMSVYRVMTENSWSSRMNEWAQRRAHHHQILQMWDAFDAWTQKRHHLTIIRKKINNRLSYVKSKAKRILENK